MRFSFLPLSVDEDDVDSSQAFSSNKRRKISEPDVRFIFFLFSFFSLDMDVYSNA
jgi:hypothetical protein